MAAVASFNPDTSKETESQTLQRYERADFLTENLFIRVQEEYREEEKEFINSSLTLNEVFLTKVYIKEDETININNVINDNNSITSGIDMTKVVASTGAPPPPDKDDKNKLDERLKLLQSFKVYDYSAEKRKEVQRKMQRYRIVEKFISDKKSRFQKKKEDYFYYFGVSPNVMKVGTIGIAIGINLLIVSSIANPSTWIYIGNVILNAAIENTETANILVYGFIDLMLGLKLFTIKEADDLRIMYKNLSKNIQDAKKVVDIDDNLKKAKSLFANNNSSLENKKVLEDAQKIWDSYNFKPDEIEKSSKLLNAYKDKDFIEHVLKLVFDPVYKKTPDVAKNAKYDKTFLSTIGNFKEFDDFFTHLHKVIDSKNIFDTTPQANELKPLANTSGDKLKTAYNIFIAMTNFYNSKQFKFILTSFQLVNPVVGYINTTIDIVKTAPNVSSSIFLKGIVEGAATGHSFTATSNMIGSQLTDFLDHVINKKMEKTKLKEISFIGGLFNESDSLKSVFQTSITSFIGIQTNGRIKGYFQKIINDSGYNEQKLLIEQQMQEDAIARVKNEMELIAKYRKSNLTNEQISELLNPTPDDNPFKFAPVKYMYYFNKKFKTYINNPEILLYSLGEVSVLFNLFYGILGVVTFEATMFSTLNGLLHYNWLDFIKCGEFYNASIAQNLPIAINIALLYLYPEGNIMLDDAIIKNLIETSRLNAINDFTSDLNYLANYFTDNIFNSKSKNAYIKKINETFLFSAFKSACDIVLQIVAIPRVKQQLLTQTALPDKFEIIKMFQSKDKCARFFSYLNVKQQKIIDSIALINSEEIIKKTCDFLLQNYDKLGIGIGMSVGASLGVGIIPGVGIGAALTTMLYNDTILNSLVPIMNEFADFNKFVYYNFIPFLKADKYFDLVPADLEWLKMRGNVIKVLKDKQPEPIMNKEKYLPGSYTIEKQYVVTNINNDFSKIDYIDLEEFGKYFNDLLSGNNYISEFNIPGLVPGTTNNIVADPDNVSIIDMLSVYYINIYKQTKSTGQMGPSTQFSDFNMVEFKNWMMEQAADIAKLDDPKRAIEYQFMNEIIINLDKSTLFDSNIQKTQKINLGNETLDFIKNEFIDKLDNLVHNDNLQSPTTGVNYPTKTANGKSSNTLFNDVKKNQFTNTIFNEKSIVDKVVPYYDLFGNLKYYRETMDTNDFISIMNIILQMTGESQKKETNDLVAKVNELSNQQNDLQILNKLYSINFRYDELFKKALDSFYKFFTDLFIPNFANFKTENIYLKYLGFDYDMFYQNMIPAFFYDSGKLNNLPRELEDLTGIEISIPGQKPWPYKKPYSDSTAIKYTNFIKGIAGVDKKCVTTINGTTKTTYLKLSNNGTTNGGNNVYTNINTGEKVECEESNLIDIDKMDFYALLFRPDVLSKIYEIKDNDKGYGGELKKIIFKDTIKDSDKFFNVIISTLKEMKLSEKNDAATSQNERDGYENLEKLLFLLENYIDNKNSSNRDKYQEILFSYFSNKNTSDLVDQADKMDRYDYIEKKLDVIKKMCIKEANIEISISELASYLNEFSLDEEKLPIDLGEIELSNIKSDNESELNEIKNNYLKFMNVIRAFKKKNQLSGASKEKINLPCNNDPSNDEKLSLQLFEGYFDSQVKLYQRYRIQQSTKLFKSIKNGIDIYKRKFGDAINLFKGEIIDLYRVFKSPKKDANNINASVPQTPTGQSNAQSTSAPSSGSTSPSASTSGTQAEIERPGETRDTSEGLGEEEANKLQEGVEESIAESQDVDQAVDESLEMGLTEEQQQQLKLELDQMIGTLFGGLSNIFSNYLANDVSKKGALGAQQGEYQDEEYDKSSEKSPHEICKNYSNDGENYWAVVLKNGKEDVGINRNNKAITKPIANSCLKENYSSKISKSINGLLFYFKGGGFTLVGYGVRLMLSGPTFYAGLLAVYTGSIISCFPLLFHAVLYKATESFINDLSKNAGNSSAFTAMIISFWSYLARDYEKSEKEFNKTISPGVLAAYNVVDEKYKICDKLIDKLGGFNKNKLSSQEINRVLNLISKDVQKNKSADYKTPIEKNLYGKIDIGIEKDPSEQVAQLSTIISSFLSDKESKAYHGFIDANGNSVIGFKQLAETYDVNTNNTLTCRKFEDMKKALNGKDINGNVDNISLIKIGIAGLCNFPPLFILFSSIMLCETTGVDYKNVNEKIVEYFDYLYQHFFDHSYWNPIPPYGGDNLLSKTLEFWAYLIRVFGGFTLGGQIQLANMLTELFAESLANDTLKDIVLTNLFGTATKNKNINLLRDYIEININSITINQKCQTKKDKVNCIKNVIFPGILEFTKKIIVGIVNVFTGIRIIMMEGLCQIPLIKNFFTCKPAKKYDHIIMKEFTKCRKTICDNAMLKKALQSFQLEFKYINASNINASSSPWYKIGAKDFDSISQNDFNNLNNQEVNTFLNDLAINYDILDNDANFKFNPDPNNPLIFNNVNESEEKEQLLKNYKNIFEYFVDLNKAKDTFISEVKTNSNTKKDGYFEYALNKLLTLFSELKGVEEDKRGEQYPGVERAGILIIPCKISENEYLIYNEDSKTLSCTKLLITTDAFKDKILMEESKILTSDKKYNIFAITEKLSINIKKQVDDLCDKTFNFEIENNNSKQNFINNVETILDNIQTPDPQNASEDEVKIYEKDKEILEKLIKDLSEEGIDEDLKKFKPEILTALMENFYNNKKSKVINKIACKYFIENNPEITQDMAMALFLTYYNISDDSSTSELLDIYNNFGNFPENSKFIKNDETRSFYEKINNNDLKKLIGSFIASRSILEYQDVFIHEVFNPDNFENVSVNKPEWKFGIDKVTFKSFLDYLYYQAATPRDIIDELLNILKYIRHELGEQKIEAFISANFPSFDKHAPITKTFMSELIEKIINERCNKIKTNLQRYLVHQKSQSTPTPSPSTAPPSTYWNFSTLLSSFDSEELKDLLYLKKIIQDKKGTLIEKKDIALPSKKVYTPKELKELIDFIKIYKIIEQKHPNFDNDFKNYMSSLIMKKFQSSRGGEFFWMEDELVAPEPNFKFRVIENKMEQFDTLVDALKPGNGLFDVTGITTTPKDLIKKFEKDLYPCGFYTNIDSNGLIVATPTKTPYLFTTSNNNLMSYFRTIYAMFTKPLKLLKYFGSSIADQIANFGLFCSDNGIPLIISFLVDKKYIISADRILDFDDKQKAQLKENFSFGFDTSVKSGFKGAPPPILNDKCISSLDDDVKQFITNNYTEQKIQATDINGNELEKSYYVLKNDIKLLDYQYDNFNLERYVKGIDNSIIQKQKKVDEMVKYAKQKMGLDENGYIYPFMVKDALDQLTNYIEGNIDFFLAEEPILYLFNMKHSSFKENKDLQEMLDKFCESSTNCNDYKNNGELDIEKLSKNFFFIKFLRDNNVLEKFRSAFIFNVFNQFTPSELVLTDLTGMEVEMEVTKPDGSIVKEKHIVYPGISDTKYLDSIKDKKVFFGNFDLKSN
jgi:hypothetical protein